jgi:hypothetical protein
MLSAVFSEPVIGRTTAATSSACVLKAVSTGRPLNLSVRRNTGDSRRCTFLELQSADPAMCASCSRGGGLLPVPGAAQHEGGPHHGGQRLTNRGQKRPDLRMQQLQDLQHEVSTLQPPRCPSNPLLSACCSHLDLGLPIECFPFSLTFWAFRARRYHLHLLLLYLPGQLQCHEYDSVQTAIGFTEHLQIVRASNDSAIANAH